MNFIFRVSFCFIIFALFSKAHAQIPENLRSKYFEEINLNIYINTDSALYYAQQLLALGVESSDSLTIAEGYESIGNCYYYKNDLPRSLHYFDLAGDIYIYLQRKDCLGVLYMDYGNVYSDMGQFAKCLKYYQKSEYLLTKFSDYPEDLALLYYNMAHVFMDLNDITNLEKYIRRAKAIFIQEEVIYLNLAIKNVEADLAIRQNNLITAENLAIEALKEARKEKDLIEQVFSFQNLAAIYVKRKLLKKGTQYQDSALSIAKIYGDQFMILAQKAKLANYHLDGKNLGAADSLAQSGYLAGQSLNSLIITKNTSLVYARVLEEKGEFKKALTLYKIYNEASDSIRGFDLSEKILQSENLLSENKNEVLKNEAELLKLNNAQNKVLTIAAIIGFCLSILIIVLLAIILRFRKRTVSALSAKQILIDQKSTELEVKNIELEKINGAKDRLFSIITHDLRQPFNQISSFIQILEHTPEIDDSLKELISEIRDSTNNTLSAMNNLLVWSKSQFLNIKTFPEKIEMPGLIESVLTEMTAGINAKNLQVKIDVEADVTLFADRNHVEIIFRNLLSNAAKFSPVGGTLKIHAQRFDNFIELAVTDEGKGMTHQEIDRLFDMENHFSTPGTLNEKGSGLGMLIVSEFVKENNGTINVDSEKNIGSTFKVLLPAA